MRKQLALIIAASMIGGVFLIEAYTYFAYPATKYAPKGLPPLAIGVYRYEFFKDGLRIGSYIFCVDRIGQYKGQDAYFTSSHTYITYRNTSMDLVTTYVFNTRLNPLEYRLNATLPDYHQTITCIFEGNTVDATLQLDNNSIQRIVDLPTDSVLIDYNMLGHWDLFFKSFELVPSKRVSFTAFIPQLLDKKEVEVVIDKETRTINVGGVDYDCRVVKNTESSSVFYLYNGSLIMLEDLEQGIAIIKGP